MNRKVQWPKLLSASTFRACVVAIGVSTEAGEIKLDGRTFTVPEGFTIERIAGPPLVDRPITAAFDDAGPSLRRRLLRLQRQCQEAARGKAAPDRAAGRQRRRRQIRQEDRLRRQDDVPRGHDVVRRLALRRRAAVASGN